MIFSQMICFRLGTRLKVNSKQYSVEHDIFFLLIGHSFYFGFTAPLPLSRSVQSIVLAIPYNVTTYFSFFCQNFIQLLLVCCIVAYINEYMGVISIKVIIIIIICYYYYYLLV